MEPWLLAALFKPFALFVLFGVVALWIRYLIFHGMPEGKVKDVLLKHRGGPKDSLCR